MRPRPARSRSTTTRRGGGHKRAGTGCSETLAPWQWRSRFLRQLRAVRANRVHGAIELETSDFTAGRRRRGGCETSDFYCPAGGRQFTSTFLSVGRSPKDMVRRNTAHQRLVQVSRFLSSAVAVVVIVLLIFPELQLELSATRSRAGELGLLRGCQPCPGRSPLVSGVRYIRRGIPTY